MNHPEFESPNRKETFLFSKTIKPSLEPIMPLIQWIPAVLSPAIKKHFIKVGHSPSSSVESENKWSYKSSPQYVFMAWAGTVLTVTVVLMFMQPCIARCVFYITNEMQLIQCFLVIVQLDAQILFNVFIYL